MIERKVTWFQKVQWIGVETAEYIIQSFRKISKEIIWLMGSALDSGQASEIARVEIEVLNIADEIDCRLRCYLLFVASSLERALMKIALEEDPDRFLNRAKWMVHIAICKVERKFKKGYVDQNLYEFLMIKLQEIIEDIEVIKNL